MQPIELRFVHEVRDRGALISRMVALGDLVAQLPIQAYKIHQYWYGIERDPCVRVCPSPM